MIGIYIIENKITGKQYIGKSIDIQARWGVHKLMYKKKNTPLYAAIKKYKLENFTFSVLETCTRTELNNLEITYIEHYNTFNVGYNLTKGGDGGVTYTWSKEQRDRQRENTVIVKYSNNRLGVKNTEEHNKRISEARKKTNGMRGKHHTKEHKLAVSKKLKYNTYNVKVVEVINTQTNKTLEFRGLTAAEEYTGIKRGTIWHRIKFSVVKNNLKFQYKTS